jgi:hypothetical protein
VGWSWRVHAVRCDAPAGKDGGRHPRLRTGQIRPSPSVGFTDSRSLTPGTRATASPALISEGWLRSSARGRPLRAFLGILDVGCQPFGSFALDVPAQPHLPPGEPANQSLALANAVALSPAQDRAVLDTPPRAIGGGSGGNRGRVNSTNARSTASPPHTSGAGSLPQERG